GEVAFDDEERIEHLFAVQTRLQTAKLCAVVDAKRGVYNLSAQVDVLFHPDTLQVEEAASALRRATILADAIERDVLGTDLPLSSFFDRLRAEVDGA
ncbi:MAG: hypothetical protein JNK45_09260, partial [Myxococcales bacterium]|nr:hypothetical protein [Myxococcales bacterium]